MATATAVVTDALRPKASTLDPFSSPAAWLQEKGWLCLGMPEWPSSGWLDPEAPATYTTTTVKVEGYVRRHVSGQQNADGSPVVQVVKEQLYAQDGSGIQGQKIPIEQTKVHFPAEPVGMPQALQIQRARDLAEQAKLTRDLAQQKKGA